MPEIDEFGNPVPPSKPKKPKKPAPAPSSGGYPGAGVSHPAPPRTPRPPTPQPPNRSPIPKAAPSEISYGPHIVAPEHKISPYLKQARNIVGLSGPRKPPPPRPSYLQRHPLIAREIVDARSYMDEFDFNNFMNDKLEEYYFNENEALRNRLANKQQKIRDYYTEAQIAQQAGDLNYTEEVPINPRLLNFPNPQGAQSPAALRAEMFERLKGLDPASDQAAAIRLLYQGDTYNKGLLDLARGPGSRQQIINYHQEQLEKIAGYQENALEKSQAYVESTNEKYKDKPEYQITDPSDHSFTVLDLMTLPGQNRFQRSQTAQKLAKIMRRGDLQVAREAMEADDNEPVTVANVKPAAAVDAGGNPIGGNPNDNAAYYKRIGATNTSDSTYDKYIQNPTGVALTFGLDKISRPLYGVMSALDYAYAQDKDPENATRRTPLGWVTGKDLGSATEDFSWGDIGGTLKAGWKGFSGGGLTGNSPNPTFGAEIIKHNAEADPETNIYDHGWYQNTAGLVLDIGGDPLSYVTFGSASAAARAGARGVRGGQKALDTYEATSPAVAKATDDFMEATGIAHMADAQEAAAIINGKVPRPRTPHEKTAHVNAVRSAVERLGEIGHQELIRRQTLGQSVRAQTVQTAQEYAARKEAVLADAGMGEVRSQLENFVAKQVQEGKLPQSAMERYDTDAMLDSMHLTGAMPDVDKHFNYWNKVAAQMDRSYSESEHYRPTLTTTRYDDKSYSYHTAEAQYVRDLETERNTFERTMQDTPAARKQLQHYEDRISIAQQRLAEKYGETTKGSYSNLMKEHAKLVRKAKKGDEQAKQNLIEFNTRMENAKARLAEEGIEDPGTDLRKLLGDDLFNDPRIKHQDIYDALNWSRGFVFNDPELAKVQGALNGTRRAVQKQRRGLAAARKNREPEAKIKAWQKGLDDAMRAHKAQQDIIHQAQGSRFVEYMKKSIKNNGEQTLRETERSFQLNRLLQEVQRRLNKVTGLEDEATPTPVKERGITDLTTGSRLEAEEGTATTFAPTEFLNSEGGWVEDVFQKPDSFYDDEQWLTYMKDQISKQLDTERSEYWNEVAGEIDLNDVPSILMKDGKIDRPKLLRHLQRNPHTGVWTRERSLGDEAWDEWADSVANYLTREYQDIRHNIARGKERDIERHIEAQAEVDWDDMVRTNVQEIAPMFAKRDGTLLTDEEALAHAIDNNKNLFPYIMDPETNQPLVFGTVKFNKRMEELYPTAGAQRPRGGLSEHEKNQIKHFLFEYREGNIDLSSITNEGFEFLRRLVDPTVFTTRQDVVDHLVGLSPKEIDALLDARPDFVPLNTKHIYAKARGEQIFQDTHGMSLQEAKELRDKYLMKTVRSYAPGWTAQFDQSGRGMTRREFVRTALQDFDSFKDVMRAGPFKYRPPGSLKTEKEARTVKRNGEWVTLSPESKEGIVRSTEWAKNAWAVLQEMPEEQAKRVLTDLFNSSRKRFRGSMADQKKRFIQGRVQAAREAGETKPDRLGRRQTSQQAFDDTLDHLDWAISTNRLVNKGYHSKLQLQRQPNIGASDTELLAYAKKNMKKDKYDEIAAMQQAAKNASHDQRRVINFQIKEAEKEIAALDDYFIEFRNQAQEAKRIYDKELRTEAILRASRIPMARVDRRAAVGILGQQFAIPGTEAFFKSVEAAAGAPLARQSAKAWQEFFGAPSRQITSDLVTARARQMGMTPAIIKRDVEALAEQFRDIHPNVRKKDWNKLRNGAKLKHIKGNESYEAIKQSFEEILPYFQGKVPLWGPNEYLTIEDINKFLKADYRVSYTLAGRRMETADDLIGAIVRRYNENSKLVRKADKGLDDPFEVLWNLRIGINQAMAHKALQHTVKSTFGVKNGWELVDGKLTKATTFSDVDAVVEGLKKEGWVPIPEIDGGTHYYPAEIAPDIRALLKMIEPHNAQMVGRFFDQINGIWKAGVTIYNPGYWTRNTIGEMMSSWLAGVNTVAPYKRAFKMMKFGDTDGAKTLDALHDQFPLLKHMEIGDQAPKGSDVLFTMKNGEKITVERALIAYHDQGLKSGFFNTEFNKQNLHGGSLRAMPGIKQAAAGHRRLRHWGENHEDWLRSAHFLDVVAKHPGSFDEAIKDAAAAVRKYHFDYSDFSHFEKIFMLRAFPFYKWTRKAAPLMLGQFFTNPGKMMVYPKTMNAVSNQLSSQDFSEDTNGFMPNFTGIAPNWLMNLMAYQTATENDNGMVDAFNLSTPQMQGLASATNPLSAGYTLANPYVKTGVEQLVGHTYGDAAFAGGSGMEISLTEPKWEGATFDESDERWKHLLRNVGGPWGNFASKSIGRNAGNYDNKISNRDLLSQLTGLGFYEPFLGDDSVPTQVESPKPPVGKQDIRKLLRRHSRRFK